MKSAIAVIVLVFGLSGPFFVGRAEAKPDASGARVAELSKPEPRKESPSHAEPGTVDLKTSKDSPDQGKEKTARRRPGAQADRCTH